VKIEIKRREKGMEVRKREKSNKEVKEIIVGTSKLEAKN